MSNETLSGILLRILGRKVSLFAWPILTATLDANGNPMLSTSGAGGQVGNPQGSANAGVTQLVANSGGTTTLATRATRRAVAITNLSTSPETIWFGFATGVTASNGMQLAAGESQVIDTTSALFFFGAAGTGTVTCVETWD